ncbi:snoRNA-binding rRNA-processing protein [Exophiala xenobiotica]|uniref:SnoRNA-binding rRNA-processing protein n=1 Tax=Lithohypha guttulata TaxID=1690604 RepID=A0ABR0KGF4_9EURO|nr:snoRNA-binding rRNA-processing protein [Lithohypha guttulata]KAK5323570.1 snoRNA-binding rRNA-processing protein [Exophiala xenobiotica]
MASTATMRRHVPLAQDIETAGGRLRTKSITGKRKSRSDEENKGDGYIDSRSSKKILAIAQDLADEDAAERRVTTAPRPARDTFDFDTRFADEEEADSYVPSHEDEDNWIPEEEEEEVLEEDMDPEEMAVYKKFLPEGDELEAFGSSLAKLSTNGAMPNAPPQTKSVEQGTNLADLILQRIAEKEALDEAEAAGIAPVRGGGDPEDAVEIPAKVVETFEKVGQILTRYKSGPLPKPFKLLPTLPQWPDLLAISQPERWTPHALYRATKIFISANTATGQHFIETVLLDRVREEIGENKKLNVHLYNAMKACFYRPAAFFKGFLFPLVQSGCTLKEANIVSSVLAKIKVPVLHSAAALLRLCEMSAEQTSQINSEAAGSANIFIRVLLGKKYALPYKVVDALVFHFLRFRGSKGVEALGANESKLPVLWHQSLLVFAQTYRNEITEDQREALLDLLLARGHKDIGPEVRRELLAGRNRGVAASQMDVDEVRDDGDDTMHIG